MKDNIHFYVEDADFSVTNEGELVYWLEMIATKYGYDIQQLDYIFCSDAYLLTLNQRYLDHDTLTDIITFPYHEPKSKAIISDIYISLDRVKDNADSMNLNFVDELHRVMIHGLLHMTGHDDNDDAAKFKMRKAEDLALSLRMF